VIRVPTYKRSFSNLTRIFARNSLLVIYHAITTERDSFGDPTALRQVVPPAETLERADSETGENLYLIVVRI